MAQTTQRLYSKMGMVCRGVVVSLIAGVCRWRSFDDVNEDFKSRPLANQALISAAVLAALFGMSLFAGYFGWIGLLVFWLIVIILVN
ncbi:MAG: hypothetical protein AAFO72_01705 [Pseudomonadota bacterium]